MAESEASSKSKELGSNIVRLDVDVAGVLHNAKEVNDLLRSIAHLTKKRV